MNEVVVVRLLFACYVAVIAYSVYRAVAGRPRWYWVAAILIYIMSALFAMSIGGLIVGAAFALAAAALVHTLHPAARSFHVCLGVLLGLTIWGAWLLLGDITWLFWPLFGPLDLLLGE